MIDRAIAMCAPKLKRIDNAGPQ